MTKLSACPICGSKNINKTAQLGMAPIVNYELMPKVFVKAAILTEYFVCSKCNIIFQNPRMSQTELNKFYGDGYYRKVINLTTKEKDLDERERSIRISKVIKEKIGNVESHLDIGCSRGYLIKKINARHSFGIDEDIKNVKFSKIRLYEKIEGIKSQKFDLITIIHTLEHISNPLAYLKKLTKYVTENGHLVIEVPTWKSPGGPLRLPHLYHFEPDVLRLMCKEVGLKVVDTEFTPHLLLICRIDNTKI